ncbi:MAG: DUF4412 domain-containing protein [Chitinophagales bacterium]
MKIKKVFFITAVLAVFHTTYTFSQKTFQGILTYKISISGGMAEMMAGMLPEKYIFEVLKNDYLLYMQGGMAADMMGKILYLDKSGIGYIIKDNEQTVYTLDMGTEQLPITEVIATDETMEILDLMCKKFLVHSNVDGITATQTVWATDAYKLPAVKNSNGVNMASSFYFEGINGLPMRTEMEVEGMNIAMEISDMQLKKLPKSDFKIPAGYAIKPFDASSIMGE